MSVVNDSRQCDLNGKLFCDGEESSFEVKAGDGIGDNFKVEAVAVVVELSITYDRIKGRLFSLAGIF